MDTAAIEDNTNPSSAPGVKVAPTPEVYDKPPRPQFGKAMLIGLGIFLVLISLATAGNFYWQNQTIRRDLAQTETTPTNTPTPSSETLREAERAEEATADWQTLSNEKFNFQVLYPPEWSVSQRNFPQMLNNQTVQTYAFSIHNDSQIPAVLEILVYPNSDKQPSQTTTAPFKIAGQTTYQTEIENGGDNSSNQTYYVASNNYTYQIGINYPDETTKDFITQILSTFKFLNNNDTGTDTSSWLNYTNTAPSFSINYPPNFNVDDNGVSPSNYTNDESAWIKTLTLTQNIYTQRAQYPAINITILKTTATAQDVINKFKADIAQFGTDPEGLFAGMGVKPPRIISQSTTTVGDHSVVKLERYAGPGAPNANITEFFLNHNGYLFIFSANYGTLDPDTQQDGTHEKDLLPQILATLKW